MFFHALILPGPEDIVLTRGRWAEISNIVRTQQVLMQ